MSAASSFGDATGYFEPLRTRAALLAKMATGRRAERVEVITADSYSHTTFKVHVDGPSPYAVAVQFARRSPSSVTTSAALLDHMATLLDVPAVLHLDGADDGGPPALVTTWLEGRSLNRLLPHLPAADLTDLARTVAATADLIWSQHLPAPGFLEPGLSVIPRPRPLAACIDAQLHDQLFASPGGEGLGPAIREKLWSLWQRARPHIEAVGQDSTLVHGDLAARNLLVRRENSGSWRISVLDWEFAVSGCHLADIGHLRRPYPFAPSRYLNSLTDALRELGRLEPANWPVIAWALDLTALTGPLVHGPGHPDNDAVTELIQTHTLKRPA